MNRLAGETSPYLLQHVGNPVDWYPWGAEALARARDEDKPILLSVGYSACHWCHVMAHESFEDEAVAALMNALFVNIKVDREERPDIDQVYQAAHAMMTRRGGGWPLTMFLTPDQEPYFGGTYFPKSARHGLPGFVDLLPRVARAYREQRDAIAEQSIQLMAALELTNPRVAEAPSGAIAETPGRAFELLARSFDRAHGGFGAAPKFPHALELEFCLRRYVLAAEARALEIVRVSLARMAEGGIHDQLGGGFCRYSVDAEWTIPHFEKMLYDNAALLSAYGDAWRVSRDPLFERAARGIVAWLGRDMRGRDGGFCLSLDADSEGEEGRFYVWSREEVRAVLANDEFAVAAAHWGLDAAPNFERRLWNLRVATPLADIARALDLDSARVAALVEDARARLFARRETRVRPGRDDKILTSWNALMIGALARAARVFGEPTWLQQARSAADFLRLALWQEGRLLATCKDGRAHLAAYLDDHAFLLAALEELMQSDFRSADLEWATALAHRLLDGFEDAQNGGFFFTAHEHEALIHRSKPGRDNATPSGNGIAARALLVLGHWLGEPRFLDAAERTVKAFAIEFADAPSGYASLLTAAADVLTPPTTVTLRGDRAACAMWQRALEATYRPRVLVLNTGTDEDLPAALAGPAFAGDEPVAYVCRGTQCLPPIRSLPALEEALREPT